MSRTDLHCGMASYPRIMDPWALNIIHLFRRLCYFGSLWLLTLNIPSLARQRCLPSWGPRRTPMVFFFNFSTVWCGRLLKLCFWGFWNYNSVIQALLASNILYLFISTEATVGTELLHTPSSLIQHLNNVIFWALSAGHFSNLQRSQPKNNKNNNIPHL